MKLIVLLLIAIIAVIVPSTSHVIKKRFLFNKFRPHGYGYGYGYPVIPAYPVVPIAPIAPIAPIGFAGPFGGGFGPYGGGFGHGCRFLSIY
ncbi:unnamed protein product [Chironomus riparius]|uniref:Uncharacterized protein n=1 Tax=Chironomus riparius TaxID=315576 RepID=A0A9N9RKR2_9DIPT|nr:unnamed protein product [Chironomus riparius]